MATHQAGPENLEFLLQSTVQPGDTVELRGEFTKPIKLQVSRVTLRSADLNAPATIKSTIRLAQPEQKVLGLKVVPGASAAAIEVAAPGCEVGWCEITGFAARGIVIGKTGTGAHVHHNWVHDQAALTGAAVAGIIAGTGRRNVGNADPGADRVPTGWRSSRRFRPSSSRAAGTKLAATR